MMYRHTTQRKALREARAILIDTLDTGCDDYDSCAPFIDVLCRSGDTIRVSLCGRRVLHERIVGHITGGAYLNLADLPCVVC